jgi:hypothetical protein
VVLQPNAYEAIKDFAANRAQYRAFLSSIDDCIFRSVEPSDDREVVREVVRTIQNSPLAAPGLTQKDACHEVANIIAAAAAVETKSYKKLIAIVNGLKGGAGWENTPFLVARACLVQHLGQTNFFLLGLINDGNADLILTIRRFLKKQGVSRAPNLATFVYFAPEFIESKLIRPGWFAQTLRDAGRYNSCNSDSYWQALKVHELIPGSVYGAIDADLPARVKAKRATGHGPSELLRAIAGDNVAKVQELVAGDGAALDQEIGFSIFEQFFHHDYGFGLDGSTRTLKARTPPRLIDAIGLFGAANTFNALVSQVTDKAKWISDGAASLLATATKTGLLQQVIENASADSLTYRTVIQFHDHDALDQLVDKGVKMQASDVDAMFTSANAQVALRYFEPEGDRLKIDLALPDGGPTVLHYIAKGNAITALREYLLAKAEAGQTVAISKSALKSRNFLHWAGWYSGAAILDFWSTEIGSIGFDQLDDEVFPPSAIAYQGLFDALEAKSLKQGLSQAMVFTRQG